ncbi:hypothetical protein H2198_003090 [Neophaeococcomyces mojaviensis]|uniref:Uncharacterized protein n=1 Tax=Neophaeococcomyces mojaviensis TaxID=3383035 RepID=A0ACC3ACB9_9EURO|nr:hypothetical protein H2198_003090 [Knufia sp. JES_112]
MLPPPNPTPDSQYSFALAKRWLNDCTINHRLCRSSEPRAMPKRLIHIRRDEQTKALSVRLITCSERVDYAALSYCWGSPQPYMTTKAVVEKPIDFAKLGKTIQDAITVSERLGLQYLWIDAICIAQHDDSEKATEIGKMADIYQGSYVTISAARAASSQEGFLSPYESDQRVQIKVSVKSPDGEINSVILHEPGSPTREGNDFGPVMDRARCLQEHVLAPRVLIYTSSTLHFCCRTHNRSDSMNVVGGVSNFQPTSLAAIEKGGKTTMEAWQSIVAEFAKRSITVESDRLPAISAVAQVRNKHLKGEYLAGLWTEHFCQQLAWAYTSYQDRQDAYYGPSFSWVALKKFDKIPASLLWSVGSRQSLQLLRTAVAPTSPDAPFGAVNFAGAYVRGRIKQAIWYPRGPKDNSAAAYFGLTLEKALRNKTLVHSYEGQTEDGRTGQPLPEYASRPPTHQLQEGDLSDEWKTDSDSEGGDAIDKIIADEREYLYSPAMLSEHADGRALADTRYKDNVPWVRGFCDTYEVEAALDPRIDTATLVWCLELFAPGNRTSGLCDGLLLASHKVEGEDVFTRIGYYVYPSKSNGQFIELDRRFLDDFELREFRLE